MIPIYLPPGSSLSELQSGAGREISNCQSCVVKQEINGAYSCTVIADVENDISIGGYILAKPRKNLQPQIFVVNYLTKSLNQITATAEHIKFMLNGLPIVTMSPGRTTVSNAVNELIMAAAALYPQGYSFPFVFNADTSRGASEEFDFPWDDLDYHTFAEMLSSESEISITGITGGFFDFDNFQISFIGQAYSAVDMSSPLEFGKNITGIDYTIDNSNVYNCAFPYYYRTNAGCQSEICFMGKAMPVWYKMGDKTFGSGSHRRITPSSIYGFDNFDPQKLKIYPVNIADVDQELVTAPAVSETPLDRICKEWVSKNKSRLSMPTVTVGISFVDLAKSPEFEKVKSFDNLRIGDKVRVIIPKLNINSAIAVASATYDSLREQFTEMTLSSALHGLSETVISQRREQVKFSKAISAMPTLIPTMTQSTIIGE